MPGEMNAISGVTVSHTLIPTLPPGYLSRRDLFPLLENSAPGTTLVIAPAGYGKSSLVAEWARSKPNNVIWMTAAEGSSLQELSATFVAATRQVVPGFGEWFEREHPVRPTDVVRRWGNDLLQTGREFIFVLDNLRGESSIDIEIAKQLLENFPSNVHFVAIRKDPLDSIYESLTSRGKVKVVTSQDLKFNDEDVRHLAQNAGVELDHSSLALIETAAGWPAAVSLLIEHINLRGSTSDVQEILSSSHEPLRALALVVLKNLDPEIINVAQKLSAVESFNLEIAELILEGDFSIPLINKIALQGEIFTQSSDPDRNYLFSRLIREILLEQLAIRPEIKQSIHQRLTPYYEERNEISLAIEHAFGSGDIVKISQLFPAATRIKQAQGKGGVIQRWARFAAMHPVEGELKAATVMITGLLADLDYVSARVEIERLELASKDSAERAFYQQFTAGARAHLSLTSGRFDDLEEMVNQVIFSPGGSYLGVDDQIALLRLAASRYCIYNELEKLEKAYNKAVELIKDTTLKTSHTHLLVIHATKLHQEGEYRRAFEMATMATRESQRNGFVGIYGPLDSLYISARCLLEFARPQEAFQQLEQIRNLSYQWKQWHWYFAIEDNYLQDLTYKGLLNEALERLRRSREFSSSLDISHQLDSIIDVNEMNVRRKLKDWDRLELLVNRAPNIRQTRQFRLTLDDERGRKNVEADAQKLPAVTPRDLIWKHLMDVSLNIDSEKKALPAMREAMKVGATVGAKETFLRQRDEMGNLIIKVANETPTVYNEELASAMAARMRDRGAQMADGHPTLTKRELEILRQLSTGRTLTVIAGELHISQNTMKTHLKNLYRKLAVEGRAQAVEKANALFLL